MNKRLISAAVLALGITSPVLGFAAQNGYQQSAQSELLIMVQQLQDEVRALRGQLETQQYKLQKLESSEADRYRDMDRRIGALTASMASGAGGAALPADSSSTASNTPDPAPTSANTPPASTSTSDIDDNQAYNDAFALVRNRQFDEALTAFNAFISDYPQSSLLANAWYWKGEILLSQQKFDDASLAFIKVVKEYPQANKVPDALYKLGVASVQSGKDSQAQQAFKQVMTDYPDTTAAGLAKNYLNR